MAAERSKFRVNMANGAPGTELPGAPAAVAEPTIQLTPTELHELIARAVAEGVRIAAGVEPEMVALLPAAEPARVDPELSIVEPVEDYSLAGLELVEDGELVVMAPELPAPGVPEPVGTERSEAENIYLSERAEREALRDQRAHYIAVAERNINRRKARLLRRLGDKRVFVKFKSGNTTKPRNSEDTPIYRMVARTEHDIPYGAREACRLNVRPLPMVSPLLPVDLLYDYPAPALVEGESLVLAGGGSEGLAVAGRFVRYGPGVLGYGETVRYEVRGTELHISAQLSETRRFAYQFNLAPGLAVGELDGPAVACLSTYAVPKKRGWFAPVGYDCELAPFRLVRLKSGGLRLDMLTGGGRASGYVNRYGDTSPVVPYEWRTVGRCTSGGGKIEAVDLPVRAAGKHIATVGAALLRRALDVVLKTTVKGSSDGVHYTNGVLLQFGGGKLDVVSTDGHRLSLYQLDGLAGVEHTDPLLLDARAVAVLAKSLPKLPRLGAKTYHDIDAMVCAIEHTETAVHFAWDGGEMSLGRLDVKFPDYLRVIPRDVDSRVHCNIAELKSACGEVLKMCKQKDQNPVARFESTGRELLTVSTDAGEIGKVSRELTCEVSGCDVRIALNPKYLLDTLALVEGEQVTLNWISEVNPVMLTWPRDPNACVIVMPIRLD